MKKNIILAVLFLLGLGTCFEPSLCASCEKGTLDGAWQTRLYEMRVEIEGDKLLVLSRNRPVLETTFTTSQDGEKCVFHLAETGLRYPVEFRNDGEDYGRITSCYIEHGEMHLWKNYFFSMGDKSEESLLSPTTESRYGNVTILTETLLPTLVGQWRSADGCELNISPDGIMTSRKEGEQEWTNPRPIAIIQDNDDPDFIRIVHQDAAEETLSPFLFFDYLDGKLITRLVATGINPPEMTFEKVL